MHKRNCSDCLVRPYGRGNSLFFLLTNSDAPTNLPNEIDLLMVAFTKFKQLYEQDHISYKVYLQRVFSDRENFVINSCEFVATANKLTAAYNRAYFALRDNRKKVIATFSRCDCFDEEVAQQFLQSCEQRPRPRPNESQDVGVFSRLAVIANRFNIFSSDVTGADLIAFRDCSLTSPLSTENVSTIVLFCSILAHHKLLPYDWKKRTTEHKQLFNTRKNNFPTQRYLVSVAHQMDVASYIGFIAPREKMNYLSRLHVLAVHVNDLLREERLNKI